MLKTIIVLPDGTEISSGVGTVNAIQSCTFTECVNSGTELTLGSVCASMIEAKLITPAGGLQIAAGDELTVYKVTDDGARHQLGIFIAEKPTRPTAHTMKLTAYDRISLLDKDLTEWVSSLAGWPYPLYDLAAMACEACGLELVNTEIPNGSYLVQPFSAEGITGRQLMQWIGQAAGRFCRATAEGNAEFAWYEPVTGHSVGITASSGSLDISFDESTGTLMLNIPGAIVATEDGTLSIASADLAAADDDNGTLIITAVGSTQHFYYQGGLSFEDYQVKPIEKVQIQSSAEDVGVVWPDEAGEKNTYRIEGNMLLTADTVDALLPVAQTLYEQLQDVTYTPGSVTIPANLDIRAGHILTVTDRNGKTITMYVMERTQTGQKDKLQCTGSASRSSTTAVNEQSYKALSGKVLNLRTDVEGLRAENRAADGRAAALALTVDGIAARVEKQGSDADTLRTQLTELEQTANAVKISVQSMQENGVSKVKTESSYTFDDAGLKIARTGSQMENLLDNTGMYVHRSGEVILQANADGVTATDVRVKNYLCIGENSRLEDYENGRTACFWIGG